MALSDLSQGCSNKSDITRMSQGRRHKVVTILLSYYVVADVLEQPCNKLLTACSKLVNNFGQAVRTQLVDGLLADLLHDVRFLRV
jgi:hypothetical protein